MRKTKSRRRNLKQKLDSEILKVEDLTSAKIMADESSQSFDDSSRPSQSEEVLDYIMSLRKLVITKWQTFLIILRETFKSKKCLARYKLK